MLTNSGGGMLRFIYVPFARTVDRDNRAKYCWMKLKFREHFCCLCISELICFQRTLAFFTRGLVLYRSQVEVVHCLMPIQGL